MQYVLEVLPLILFFLAFKLYGIYTATLVGIIATFLQTIFTRMISGAWNKNQVITLMVFIVFGSMTLYFHNPIFVKWKPTIVFWIFSIIMLGSHFTQKPLIERMMENMLKGQGFIPALVWKRLNMVWALFFLILGSINLYIAYEFSNDAWVNFKVFGISAALFLLIVFQMFYLMRYLENK